MKPESLFVLSFFPLLSMCMYRVQLDLNRIKVLLDNKSEEKDNKFESVNKSFYIADGDKVI